MAGPKTARRAEEVLPVPPRSPERERLAEAITARNAARERLANLRAAHDRADDAVFQAHRVVDRAAETLRDARAGENRVLADAFVAGNAPPDDVHKATKAHADAEARLATMRRARDAVTAELEPAQRALRYAEDDMKRAVMEVALASPEICRALNQFAVAYLGLVKAARPIAFLRDAGVLPLPTAGGERQALAAEHPEVAQRYELPDAAENFIDFGVEPASPDWAEALAALADDADAALPSVESS